MMKTAYILLKAGLSLILSLILLAGGQNTALAQSVGVLDAVGTKLSVVLDDDGSATAGPEEPPSIKETLQAVCQARGYGDDCAKILLGMSWKESRHVATAVGDHGQARGWFQIHYRLHHITAACAEDLKCSANWTIDYLESNGYPKYVRYAVQCHNSCGFKNGYAASVLAQGERLWRAEAAKPIAQVTLAAK
jgi:hypothetical protein